jgi:ABC-type uncharacterized transport system fused permease/ATPase subunit
MGFACLLDTEEGLSYSLALAVSILTHSGSIYLEITQENSFLVQAYMIICTFCMIYTASVVFIWIKPSIKLEEEKEKHLASFLAGIKNKNIDYGL